MRGAPGARYHWYWTPARLVPVELLLGRGRHDGSQPLYQSGAPPPQFRSPGSQLRAGWAGPNYPVTQENPSSQPATHRSWHPQEELS
ncbi:hypothetical protein GCM10027030_22700 [Luteococcus sediminum]